MGQKSGSCLPRTGRSPPVPLALGNEIHIKRSLEAELLAELLYL